LNFDFQQIPGHRSVVLEALHPGQTQAHHFALNPQVPVHVKVGQRPTVAIGLQATERQPYVLAQRQGFQRRFGLGRQRLLFEPRPAQRQLGDWIPPRRTTRPCSRTRVSPSVTSVTTPHPASTKSWAAAGAAIIIAPARSQKRRRTIPWNLSKWRHKFDRQFENFAWETKCRYQASIGYDRALPQRSSLWRVPSAPHFRRRRNFTRPGCFWTRSQRISGFMCWA